MQTPFDGAKRRRLLGALPLMLLAGARSGVAADAEVKWKDIRLIDGRVLRAADLRRQTVVVQLWASWCPFCLRQNPHIQKLHEAGSGQGLQVLTFSIDKTEQDARDYLARRGYTFPTAMAGADVAAWFGERRTLPELYVVDPSGRVVFREGGEMFPEDIAALLRFAPDR
jgi:thiol-disulfide isomerase/thioredoxin